MVRIGIPNLQNNPKSLSKEAEQLYDLLNDSASFKHYILWSLLFKAKWLRGTIRSLIIRIINLQCHMRPCTMRPCTIAQNYQYVLYLSNPTLLLHQNSTIRYKRACQDQLSYKTITMSQRAWLKDKIITILSYKKIMSQRAWSKYMKK